MKKVSIFFLVVSLLAPFGMNSALAEGEVSVSQLRAIEKKQDKILQALEELKSEVQIVKIRVTSR